MKIAVTGTIGSGKSTLCGKLMNDLPEFTFVSIDDLVRGLYDNESFKKYLSSAFGTVERKEVSAIAFSSPRKLAELEEVSSGYIDDLMHSALSHESVVVEFPLLFEKSTFSQHADLVIAVGCDDAIASQRVVNRDGVTHKKFQSIRACQFSTELRAALADVYIDTGLPQPEQEENYQMLIGLIRTKQLKERAKEFFGSGWENIWKAIEEHYSEPHRKYHNLTHLHELFSLLDQHKANSNYAAAIELAVWFHDLVYSTGPEYGTNEARSAKKMVKIISDAKPYWAVPGYAMHNQLFLAVEMILATKKHKMSAPMVVADKHKLHAANLFLDADLAILAADRPKLLKYDSQIESEWQVGSQISKANFVDGRAYALGLFLNNRPIFTTTEFSHLESVAVENISRYVRSSRF